MFKLWIIDYSVVTWPFNWHPTLANNIIYYHKADTNWSYPDATWNNHTWTIDGATYTASGKINGAYDYDGTNDRITLADSTDFDHSWGFTVSCWVNFDTSWSWEFIIHRWDANSQNLYHISKQSTDKIRFNIFISWVSTTIDSNSALSTWVWYHVVCRRNSSNLMEMFINWTKQTASATKSWTTNPTWTATYNIWSSNIPALFFDWTIDETAEWQRGLTDSEVSDLYNSGSGLQY